MIVSFGRISLDLILPALGDLGHDCVQPRETKVFNLELCLLLLNSLKDNIWTQRQYF